MKRRILLAVLALFLFGIGYVAWTLAGLPPVRYYLRYGLDPYCEPTGAKETHEGVEFIEIGPGIFRMGSTYLAEGGDWLGKICAPFGLPWGKQPKPSNEMPVHWVEFKQGFWIATTELTREQYGRFDPEFEPRDVIEGDPYPVVGLSWEEANEYCAWLARKTDRPIRLPTEAEWECACRAGSETEFCFGDDPDQLAEYAWFKENSDNRLHSVAQKRPNNWGLHDLHGNAWEWCADQWHGSYDGAPADGSARVIVPAQPYVFRGGSWWNTAEYSRSGYRVSAKPIEQYTRQRSYSNGFRPAFTSASDQPVGKSGQTGR